MNTTQYEFITRGTSMSKNDSNLFDKNDGELTKYDGFSNEPRPTKADLETLSENLKKLLENTPEPSGKKKMSYSISGLSQLLIKNAADQYGVTQSSVIELAPFLFGMIAEKSLERRTESLSVLRLLAHQMLASLTAFQETAPHLSAFTGHIRIILEELLAIEEQAVNSRNYIGVDASGSEILSRISNTRTEPAYYLDVEGTLDHFKQLDSQFHYFKTQTGG